MNITAIRLRKLREAKKLSQEECATALGIDRTTYAKYENGGSIKRNVDRLASFFNVSTDYLFGNDIFTPTTGTQYYDDPEVARMANELKNNPDLHILFDASKKLTKKDLEAVITIVQKMSSEE